MERGEETKFFKAKHSQNPDQRFTKYAERSRTYLARKLLVFLLEVWEVPLHHLRVVLLGPSKNLLQREPFVVRHCEVPDLRRFENALGTVRHVPQVPDCDCILLRTKCFHVLGQEVEDLFLVRELARELGHGYPDLLVWWSTFHCKAV